jgi:hypothetical protein
MATHELKSWPGQFQATGIGLKRAEFRRDHRGYQLGDQLEWREWDPTRQEDTGFHLTARVTLLTSEKSFPPEKIQKVCDLLNKLEQCLKPFQS